MSQVPQKIIDLYDQFTHGGMDRRAFLDRLTRLAGGAAAASAALALLQSDYAVAQIVKEDDARLNLGEITTDGPHGAVKCYMARLKGGVKRPTVLVIHENRGLNPHIKDVARRMALEGFLVFAPDALTPRAARRPMRTRRATCSASSTSARRGSCWPPSSRR